MIILDKEILLIYGALRLVLI